MARASEEREGAEPLVVRVEIGTQTIVKVIGFVLGTMAGLWLLGEASGLVGMLVVSFFFSLALQPGVQLLTNRYGWKRGTATGAIYLGGLVFLLLMVAIMVPAVVELAKVVGQKGAGWVTSLGDLLRDRFGIEIPALLEGGELSDEVAKALLDWGSDAFGSVVGIATSGLGMVFDLMTIAMFTFYLTADFPRLRAVVLSHLPPERQQQIGWAWDEAIVQTGGYFYSRLILMLINGAGFLFTMVAVGVPVTLAIALAVFGGFVSVFIPAIGTYIGGAIPVLLTLALRGLVPGLVVLGYVVVYQQVENYWLSPKISANTMSLNGAVAFGAALFGGAVAGPMGAFMALPVAALVTSLASNYLESHEIVYRSDYEEAAVDERDD